ncbi:MAG: acyl carrier protein [Mucilaginibacter sp.]
MNEITLKIYQLIKDKLEIDESAITSNASFYNDLEVDSLDFCELIVDVEKEFDITIPDDRYERLKTVGALVNYVITRVDDSLPKVSTMNTTVAENLLSA